MDREVRHEIVRGGRRAACPLRLLVAIVQQAALKEPFHHHHRIIILLSINNRHEHTWWLVTRKDTSYEQQSCRMDTTTGGFARCNGVLRTSYLLTITVRRQTLWVCIPAPDRINVLWFQRTSQAFFIILGVLNLCKWVHTLLL
jgi:hypothetical protein